MISMGIKPEQMFSQGDDFDGLARRAGMSFISPHMADAKTIAARLQQAINTHDLDAIVACFDPNVESVQPAHPARDFRGSAQVRRSWSQILGAVPNLEAEIVRSSVAGKEAWVEWCWRGTRADGQVFEMAGVTIFELAGGLVARVRFFMEPIDHASAP
jgi:ketosteroid isomerase-like protein